MRLGTLLCGSTCYGFAAGLSQTQVSAQTGLTPQEAQQRVDTAVTSIREAADKARKTSSVVGFFTALSMLLGAFIASAAAGYAGNLRDDHGDILVRR